MQFVREHINSILGGIIGIAIAVISLVLLLSEKIDGGVFATIFIAGIFIGLIIPLLPRALEVSIAGNVIKLGKITKSAEDLVDMLVKQQIVTFKLLLKHTLNPSGVFNNGIENAGEFKTIYDSIIESKLEKELSEDLYKVSSRFCFLIQRRVCERVKCEFSDKKLLTKIELQCKVITDNSIDRGMEGIKSQSKEEFKVDLLEVIELYGYFLDIRCKLMATYPSLAGPSEA